MLSLSRIAGLGTIAIVTAFSVAALAVSPAAAKCTRLGFSVNDYGKDGPTKDAKELLDKHIAKWAADNKIAKYTVGKKDVSCELFLNFIVFDEHTCRAEATVCFNEPAGGVKLPQDANLTPAPKAEKAEKKSAKAEPAAEKPAHTKRTHGPVVTRSKAPTETGTVPAAAPAASEPAASIAAPETAPPPPAAAPAPAPAVDKAAEAAAAAERAAAAAERAAAAAERAAAAAKPKPIAAPAAAPAEAAPAAPAAPRVVQ